MTWLGLDALTRPLKSLVRYQEQTPMARAPLQERATAIAMAHFGPVVLDPSGGMLASINVAALSIRASGAPSVYHVRPSASRVVDETDLRSIPTEPPPLLRRPGIVEARRPETGERIFGDVASLGWYTAGAEAGKLLPVTYVIGLSYPDSIFVGRWTPDWTGKDLDAELPEPEWGNELLQSAVEKLEHNEFVRAAARYLVIFGLLEQVDNGPLRFELDKKTGKRNVWIKDPPKRPKATATEKLIEPIDPERVLGDTKIRGHLKRVRTGEGRANVEWRYVEGYTGKRWFGPRYTVERDHKHPGLANDALVYRGKKES